MKRSKWKNLFVNLLKLENSNQLKKTKVSIVAPRNSSITPNFVGLTFQVHTGKTLKKIIVTEEMVGHKFGEFAKTRSEFVFKKKKKKKA